MTVAGCMTAQISVEIKAKNRGGASQGRVVMVAAASSAVAPASGSRFNVGDCVDMGGGEKAWIVAVLGVGRYAVDYRDGQTSYEEADESQMRPYGVG